MTVITVEVRPLHRGRDIKVEIEKDNTVDNLKTKLQGNEEYGVLGFHGKYHLLFSQRKLENTKKLSEYNIQNGSLIYILPGERPLTTRPGLNRSLGFEIEATNTALELSIRGGDSSIESSEDKSFHQLTLYERWKLNEVIITNMYSDQTVEYPIGQNEILDSIEKRNMFRKFLGHIKAEYKRALREKNPKVLDIYKRSVIGKDLRGQTWKEAKQLKKEIEQAFYLS